MTANPASDMPAGNCQRDAVQGHHGRIIPMIVPVPSLPSSSSDFFGAGVIEGVSSILYECLVLVDVVEDCFSFSELDFDVVVAIVVLELLEVSEFVREEMSVLSVRVSEVD